MSDETTNTGNAPAGPAADTPRPQLRIVSQYVKDLSFESPRPPQQLPHTMGMPQISITVNVNVQPLNTEKTEYEAALSLQAKAESDNKPVFIAELVYAGVVVLTNVSEELKPPLTLIEAPRLLFPFARRIIADLVRDGGFPPLMIEPIDFADLFRRHVANQQAAAQQTGTPPGQA